MKKVYICSRYRADEKHTIEENVEKAAEACRHAAFEGYAPYAPHLYLPQCLDDNKPGERRLGMKIGQEFLRECDEVWQWGIEISEGMAAELEIARDLSIPIRVFDGIYCGPIREITGSYAFIKHGKWSELSLDDQDEGMYRCSECKAVEFMPEEEDIYEFCPHCGAKMDRKE